MIDSLVLVVLCKECAGEAGGDLGRREGVPQLVCSFLLTLMHQLACFMVSVQG